MQFDLLFNISTYLTHQNIGKSSTINTSSSILFNDNYFWYMLLQRDFPYIICTRMDDCKAKYKLQLRCMMTLKHIVTRVTDFHQNKNPTSEMYILTPASMLPYLTDLSAMQYTNITITVQHKNYTIYHPDIEQLYTLISNDPVLTKQASKVRHSLRIVRKPGVDQRMLVNHGRSAQKALCVPELVYINDKPVTLNFNLSLASHLFHIIDHYRLTFYHDVFRVMRGVFKRYIETQLKISK